MPLFGSLFAGRRPDDLGHDDGRLRPPPATRTCAHSQVDPQHPAHVAPLQGSFESVVAAVEAHDDVRVITRQHDYVHAEATTSLMGLVDDIELVPDGKQVHVRSAARLGRSDFGKNAKRLDQVRTRLSHR